MIKIPAGAPTPAMHAGMLAILGTDGSPTEAIKYIRKNGWFTSPNTLYGSKGKLGILDGLVGKGFAKKTGNKYILTDEGLKWVDSEHIILGQNDKIGSEDHKQLLVKTIEKLHQQNMLVISPSEKHSFDLVAWPMDEKKRYLWDLRGAKGYEAQTSARRDSIEMNMDKGKLWGVPVVWITDDREIMNEMERITNNKDEYLMLGDSVQR